ncbi:MAG: hypothetical protein ACFB6R_00735 [Alphaproteobacteria bacterium]
MASIALRETAPGAAAGSVGAPRMTAEPMTWITLRRSGRQPLRFKGALLAEATGHASEGRLWHELNIYSRQTGGFVVDLRVFKKDRGQKDIFHVHAFETLGEVVSFLEDFDPTADVPVNVDTDAPGCTTARLTLKAVALRQRIEDVTRDYRSLVGDLLFQLEAVETAS